MRNFDDLLCRCSVFLLRTRTDLHLELAPASVFKLAVDFMMLRVRDITGGRRSLLRRFVCCQTFRTRRNSPTRLFTGSFTIVFTGVGGMLQIMARCRNTEQNESATRNATGFEACRRQWLDLLMTARSRSGVKRALLTCVNFYCVKLPSKKEHARLYGLCGVVHFRCISILSTPIPSVAKRSGFSGERWLLGFPSDLLCLGILFRACCPRRHELLPRYAMNHRDTNGTKLIFVVLYCCPIYPDNFA